MSEGAPPGELSEALQRLRLRVRATAGSSVTACRSVPTQGGGPTPGGLSAELHEECPSDGLSAPSCRTPWERRVEKSQLARAGYDEGCRVLMVFAGDGLDLEASGPVLAIAAAELPVTRRERCGAGLAGLDARPFPVGRESMGEIVRQRRNVPIRAAAQNELPAIGPALRAFDVPPAGRCRIEMGMSRSASAARAKPVGAPVVLLTESDLLRDPVARDLRDDVQRAVDPRGQSPAVVMILPLSTKRWSSTTLIFGYWARSFGMLPLVVVAVRPSSKPAFARMNAPLQTDIVCSVCAAVASTHASVGSLSERAAHPAARDDEDVGLRGVGERVLGHDRHAGQPSSIGSLVSATV